MQFHDGENDAIPQADNAVLPPATDFGRRRVSRILNSETPRREQHYDNTFTAWELMEQIMSATEHKGTITWRYRPGLAVDVCCRWRRTMVWANHNVGACYRAKKQLANLNQPQV